MEKKKVGRPRIGDKPLTKSEQMVRYRQKLKERGKLTVTVSMSEQVMVAVDLYRSETGQTRGDAIDEIINDFLKHWAEDYALLDEGIKAMEQNRVEAIDEATVDFFKNWPSEY